MAFASLSAGNRSCPSTAATTPKMRAILLLAAIEDATVSFTAVLSLFPNASMKASPWSACAATGTDLRLAICQTMCPCKGNCQGELFPGGLVLETTLHSSIPGPCAFLVQQVADFRFLKEWQSAATCAFLDKSLERCKPWCALVTLYKICGPLRVAPIVHSSLIADGWLQTDPAQESCPCGSDFSLLQLRAD